MVTRLRTLRESKGFTQADVAKACGVNTLSYQRYESKERTPKADVAAKLAKALGTTVEALWGAPSPQWEKPSPSIVPREEI